MKKISRRDLLRLTTIAAASSLASACAQTPSRSSSSSAPSESGAPKPADATPKEAPSGETITLRYHHRVGTECDNHASWIPKFKETHPNVEIKMECTPSADYFKKLNTLIAGGTLGDGFWISSIEGFYRLAASSAVAPIDDLVKTKNFDLGQFYKQNVEAAKLKGVLYGLPQLAHPGRVGLFYSKLAFDKAGVEAPTTKWTYDDLLNAAKKITNEKEGVYGFQPSTDYFSLLVYQRAWAGDMLNGDGTKAILNAPESVKALEFVQSLFYDHKVAPAPSTNLNQEQLMKSGKLAMFQSGFWGSYIKNFMKPEEWGVVPMPYGPTGKRGSMFESDPVCINAVSQHKSEMFDFFTLFTTHEAQVQNYQRMGATSVRPDVMNDAELQKDPTMKAFGTVMAEAGPLVLPANFRETEYFKTIDERLQLAWLGEKKIAEIIEEVQRDAQAILDKPSLSATG